MGRFLTGIVASFALLQTCLAGDVSSYRSKEYKVAKAGLFANIGTSGAKPGVVVASPSTVNPDYVYTWTRDSSLVYKWIIDQYTLGRDTSKSTLKYITDFVAAEGILQTVPNLSGNVGEPKFEVNLTAFNGSWGRPQRDGPALRATAMITLGNYFISEGNKSYPANTLWPKIQIDLDFVASTWNMTGFDLWEEVDGSSFFTIAVQHRGLREGAKFAVKQKDYVRAGTYTSAADSLLCFLQSFWSTTSSALIANINVDNGRSGLDVNTILGIIHTFDPKATPNDVSTFQPASDMALLNHYSTVNAFRSIYGINSGIAAGSAVNIGRYPEDVYYNGNPWYLATLAAAEQLYYALYQWDQAGKINVTSISLPFFTQLVSGTTVGVYKSSSKAYSKLVSAVTKYADGFVELAAQYTPADGQLSEQYNKANGTQLSAEKLTWSFASALTALDAKKGDFSASWGAKGLTTTCVGGGAGPGPKVPITFNEEIGSASVVAGATVGIVGSIAQLNNWASGDPIELTSLGNSSWTVTIEIPAGSSFEYKYIQTLNGTVTWESDPNRSLTAPSNGSYTENDVWR
ncbi:glucoamylase G2 [Clavulina sp. PMI_390]|nr:glucoamylase G2 [Clavulina sp. PMI_390]